MNLNFINCLLFVGWSGFSGVPAFEFFLWTVFPLTPLVGVDGSELGPNSVNPFGVDGSGVLVPDEETLC